MTGLRLGYLATPDAALRERIKKVLFYTCSNVTSIVQFGGIGALEGSQDSRRRSSATSCRPGATSSTTAFARTPAGCSPARRRAARSTRSCASIRHGRHERGTSLSWAMAEQLISRARIGCVPGVDFGPHGEGYIRFCFARDRRELTGALESMGRVFGQRAVSGPAAAS